MKKYIVLMAVLLAGFPAFAQRNDSSRSIEAGVQKAAHQASYCRSEACFVKAVQDNNWTRVNRSLREAKGYKLKDFVWADFNVNGRHMYLLDYLFYKDEMSKAHELYNVYLSGEVASSEKYVNLLLEKLAFKKDYPQRDVFARSVKKDGLMGGALSARTLKYALTQAKDEAGYNYVKLLTDNTRLTPMNAIDDSRLNLASYANPMSLPSSWDVEAVLNNELKYTYNAAQLRWLNKTKDLLRQRVLLYY